MQFGATFTLFNSAVVAPGMDGQKESGIIWKDMTVKVYIVTSVDEVWVADMI